MRHNLKLKFLGACGEVTGSCVMLESETIRIILDCGARQGRETVYKIPFDGSIDYCLLSHAHLDHSGALPLLVKENRIKGKIYSTPATKEVALILLLDAAKIQKEESEKRGRPIAYNEEDVLKLTGIWETHDYNQKFEINDFEMEFLDAGHILGAAFILLELTGNSFLYTGDIGTKLTRLMKKPQIPKEDIDYLIIESTYGDRVHKEDQIEFKSIIEETLKNGGKVLIPAFAVGRAQEVMIALKELKLDNYPIYLDSPMAEKVTDLTDYYYPYLEERYKQYVEKEGTLFDLNNLNFVHSNNASLELAQEKNPMIILAASSMLSGGRVLNHLPSVLGDKKSTLLFVGYQAVGTLGRRIVNGEQWYSPANGEGFQIVCQVHKLDGFSAHADKDELLEFVKGLKVLPYETFIIHGEDDAQKELEKNLKGSRLRVHTPRLNDIYEISGGARESLISLGFKPNFLKFEDIEIYPFAGALIKHKDKIEVITSEQYIEILRKKDEEMREKLGRPEVKSKLIEEPKEKEVSPISEDEFYDALWQLKGEELLSKKKLQEFANELKKGVDSALAWVNFTVQKGRFVAGGSQEENKEVGNILKRGIKCLGMKARIIAEKVWEES